MKKELSFTINGIIWAINSSLIGLYLFTIPLHDPPKDELILSIVLFLACLLLYQHNKERLRELQNERNNTQ